MTTWLAADYLRLHPRTVMERARKGELPARKFGHDWRFSRRALDEALSGRREPPEADQVLTSEEVCVLLGFGAHKVGRLARTGELPSTGTGRARRFSRAAILGLLHTPPSH
ncbi:helix-turn-helix domain-containing protein [Streptomyces sp. NPDC059193]|uniref:helix-turn-helix domain-containing protein n=1 Tax=Streptomyces sp. NPDC059193 TaxID=3346763 RepID=UPI0036C242CE